MGLGLGFGFGLAFGFGLGPGMPVVEDGGARSARTDARVGAMPCAAVVRRVEEEARLELVL